ncbi:MAG: hypothetical protein K6T34_07410 [Thermoflavifilum sp.]|nr:hypothetical protein [Thermoflavifilum sp.]
MKKFKLVFYRFFPVQLTLLHLRHYPLLILIWVMLFAMVGGYFARSFGAHTLFLAPEYLGQVGFYGFLILGITTGTFMMSWNITTFILHSKRFRFLATTTQPFFKYCLNNAFIPVLFYLFFIWHLVRYQREEELTDWATIGFFIEAYTIGILAIIFISFFYFFNADRTILKSLQKRMGGTRKILSQILKKEEYTDEEALPVKYYLNSPLHIRRARDVSHYDPAFLSSIFREHHFAAVLSILFALVLMVILSYLISLPAFRIPAGSSILLFLTVLMGLLGAFSYFFHSWSLPIAAGLLIVLNLLIKYDIIDTRSKAYGLDYRNRKSRPAYTLQAFDSLFTRKRTQQDAFVTEQILEHWYQKQHEDKPSLIVINVSGGGSRAATWALEVLQYADSLTHDQLMKHTVLITGASGGMLGAAYFRELYLRYVTTHAIDLYDHAYVDNIAKDLLNAIMAYYAVNDYFSFFQSFYIDSNRYVKDRGYAFEQQLNLNTHGVLNKSLEDYRKPESLALIPLLLVTATVTADGRCLLISPQHMSYLTYPKMPAGIDSTDKPIDAIDFMTYFAGLHPEKLLFTDALRMSATFPYILPNVYLPTRPIIDVMDAGLRDNYGQEMGLRFLHVFRHWINTHTSEVIFLQIRDNPRDTLSPMAPQKDLRDMLWEPLFIVQKNWASFQNYYQNDMISYARHFLQVPFRHIIFQYIPQPGQQSAPLNWHLTTREKQDIHQALFDRANQQALQQLRHALTAP